SARLAFVGLSQHCSAHGANFFAHAGSLSGLARGREDRPVTRIHLRIGRGYPDGMADTTPKTVTADPVNFSIRLPHWGWFLAAIVLLVIATVALPIWLPYYRERQAIQKIESWGGNVAATETFGPEWLQNFVGEDRMEKLKVFDRAVFVILEGP